MTDGREAKGTPDPGEVEARAREVLGMMSLGEKVGAMSGDLPFWPGLVEMLGGGYNVRPYPAGENERLGLPGLLFTDGPRGVVMGESTCFPVSMARGATWDPDLEERVGDAIGVEARVQGANLFAGVCVNLLRHPAWGRAQETYGEDPYHLGEMGAALVRGVQRHAMACVKHYALNSMENARFKVDVRVSERALHEVYLPHFRRCVDEGVAGVMSAYNKVNGEYCGQNRRLLTGILKDGWGFEGFVISDFLLGLYDAKAGALAGLDVEMPFENLYARHLADLVEAGEVDEEVIDGAVLRVLRQQIRFSELGEPGRYVEGAVAGEEHRALAREAAEKSIVLLKNEPVGGVPVLPLDARNVRRLAVVGRLAGVPNIGDRGSSNVHPPYVVTPLDGLRAALEPGSEVVHHDGSDPETVVEVAGSADAALVVVGFTHDDEGEFIEFSDDIFTSGLFPPLEDPALAREFQETMAAAAEGRGMGPGGDRRSLRLRDEDEDLIRAVAGANPRTVVAIMGGSAVITEGWRDLTPAILMLWYPGMEGGNALADILLGEVNPSGKLPCVFPRSEDDLPPFDPDADEIEYGLFHGHRLLEKRGAEPAFPFGFGLCYTTFAYENLRLETDEIDPRGTLRVGVEVTNTGGNAGEEVVQLYVGVEGSGVERPVKELKGFSRVRLRPGESTTVTIEVPASRLAYYDEEASGWVVEPATYRAVAAPHSTAPDAPQVGFRVVRET